MLPEPSPLVAPAPLIPPALDLRAQQRAEKYRQWGEATRARLAAERQSESDGPATPRRYVKRADGWESPRMCSRCGKVFRARRWRAALYCSPACRMQAYRLRRAKREGRVYIMRPRRRPA